MEYIVITVMGSIVMVLYLVLTEYSSFSNEAHKITELLKVCKTLDDLEIINQRFDLLKEQAVTTYKENRLRQVAILLKEKNTAFRNIPKQ